MDVTIRLARENDFEKLAELIQEFARFENHPEAMVNSVERMKQERNYFSCFVAENEENDITGYAAWFYSYYTWSGKSLYIDDLYVKEEFRGRGIGRKLLQQVIDFARKSGCHKVRWQVSDWNEQARKFYTDIGAEIDSTKLNCDLTISG